ncbi:hypothetical protein SNE25_19745 [Mucilaginibacter sabulilitoris]|uniref:Uncharacterized protein n=1 Tax=Mucilaginibacter sabulilitoris TaxID=1173583 RepID=A0ABZ0TK38_9SPHI|nr:hypothetical protein [Mucilaginibacter sabulilitoris]WPU91555.1 hypothetical protein SNE25_19745 [Mucilaginibacter sabulilitoris]
MKTPLRIASILMLLHTFGHIVGAFTWKKAPNPSIQKVVDDMQSNHFAFMGKQVSLGSFFDGFGFTMIGVLLLLTIILWQLPERKFILPIGLFLLFMGIIELIYFFPFAAAFSLLAGILTLYAFIQWKPSN